MKNNFYWSFGGRIKENEIFEGVLVREFDEKFTYNLPVIWAGSEDIESQKPKQL